jgi:hypothetical protein
VNTDRCFYFDAYAFNKQTFYPKLKSQQTIPSKTPSMLNGPIPGIEPS